MEMERGRCMEMEMERRKEITLNNCSHIEELICIVCIFLLLQQFPSVVVMYSLKAMRYGCRTAIQRFPRLLQLLELYPATTNDFKKKVCVCIHSCWFCMFSILITSNIHVDAKTGV